MLTRDVGPGWSQGRDVDRPPPLSLVLESKRHVLRDRRCHRDRRIRQSLPGGLPAAGSNLGWQAAGMWSDMWSEWCLLEAQWSEWCLLEARWSEWCLLEARWREWCLLEARCLSGGAFHLRLPARRQPPGCVTIWSESAMWSLLK